MSWPSYHQKSVTRRERQDELKRQRGVKKPSHKKIFAMATGILVVVAIIAVATTGLLSSSSDSNSARRKTPTTNTVTTAVVTPENKCRTPLTPANPLQLWIGGDSLAGSLGPSLGQQMADTGIVQPTYDSRVSSGLGNSDFFDWPTQASEEMGRLNPEVVVFIIGTNDYSLVRTNPIDATGVPIWKAKYAEQVDTMLKIFESGGTPVTQRKIYWVSGPTIKETRIDAGVKEINAVAQTVITRHPQVTFVDSYALFSATTGGYSTNIDIEDGKSTRVRTDDGIHFTPSGGDFLGRTVGTLINNYCRTASQAVAGQPKPVLRTPGSTRIPGTYRETETTPTTESPTTTIPITTTTTAAKEEPAPAVEGASDLTGADTPHADR